MLPHLAFEVPMGQRCVEVWKNELNCNVQITIESMLSTDATSKKIDSIDNSL
jgi:hypothetical protein